MRRSTPGSRELLAMRDLADGQLVSADGVNVGRVADLIVRIEADGSARIQVLCVGPEAGLGRIWGPVRTVAHLLLRGKFEHELDLGIVSEVNETITLTRRADDLPCASGERWVNRRILRFIPGHGG